MAGGEPKGITGVYSMTTMTALIALDVVEQCEALKPTSNLWLNITYYSSR